MNRRIFLKSTTAATTWLCVRTSTALNSGAAAIRSDDLLAEARQRIEKNRRGDGIIQVRDGQGNRIANATVKVDQLWHDFLFGSNAFMLGRTRDPDLEKEYRRHFEALLNYATLGFYWGAYEPVRGKPDYEYTDTA
ncbi:MAG: hypothetical protein H8D72_01205, partial [Planctomycetes bacterium]|nr:hypothetical protein [Planctomycetota bacterium]